jgi:hypothetical protein
MKCLCGYYHLEDWQIEREDESFQAEIRQNNGSKQFINIIGTFLREYDSWNKQEVSIFACPRCGALKIDMGDY